MSTTLFLLVTDSVVDGDHLQPPDEAQPAAAAFLARYNGRTLEAYRHDLRYYFQWATDQHLHLLSATRAHIEIYRSTMEQRGLAASTIDRRLSTVCGYYRFRPHRRPDPGQPSPVRAPTPRCSPSSSTGWTAANSAASCSPPSTMTELTRRSRCCSVSTGCGFRGVRHERRGPLIRAWAPHPADRRQRQQARDDSARATHRAHDRPGSGNDTKVRSCNVAMGSAWTDVQRTVGCARSANEPALVTSTPHAACSVHHGRAGRRRPAARRSARSSSRRPSHHDDLRSPPTELRPPRRLRRRRLRRQRLNTTPGITAPLGRQPHSPSRWAVRHCSRGTS